MLAFRARGCTPELNAEIMARLKPMLDAIEEDEQRRKAR